MSVAWGVHSLSYILAWVAISEKKEAECKRKKSQQKKKRPDRNPEILPGNIAPPFCIRIPVFFGGLLLPISHAEAPAPAFRLTLYLIKPGFGRERAIILLSSQ